MIRLSEEAAEDWWEVEALFDLCFAPGREALSSYRLREGVAPVAPLCLVARDGDGILAAAIRYFPVQVAEAPALLLGPIAVHPTRQGEGLGGYLMRESLDLAGRWAGAGCCWSAITPITGGSAFTSWPMCRCRRPPTPTGCSGGRWFPAPGTGSRGR